MILNYISSSIRAVSEAKDSLASKLPDGLDSLYHNSPLSEHLHNQIHNNHEFISPDAGWFWDWSVSTTLALTIVLIIIFLGVWLVSQKYGKKISLKLGFWNAFILGVIVYDLGMCTGPKISLITNVPMAIVHSLEMFAFNSDISAIHEPFHNSWQYMCLFSFAHAFAATVSLVFVINHFGYNIMAKFRLWRISLFGNKRKNLYVFWGVNEANFLLAEDIKRHHEKRIKNIIKDDTIDDKSSLLNDEKYRIIMVRTGIEDEEDENSNHKIGFDKIFDFLSLKTSEIDRMRVLDCLTCSTFKSLNNISVNIGDRGTIDVLGSKLKLKSLRRIIKNTTPGKVHIVMLSDDEESNLHAVSVLSHDITLRSLAEGKPSVCDLDDIIIFHCRARNNFIHEVIEDTNLRRGMMVKIVDSSHLSVEMLKEEEVSLPANYVAVEKDATVSSAFNGLVIGFSEVGKDTVRFLYENAAFVKSGSRDGCVERSDFHLEVIDKRMSELAGTFLFKAPNMANSISYTPDEENKDALISLKTMDCRSIEFFNYLSKNIEDLNYIVIATEDDELNISMAVRIFKSAQRYRRNFDNFIILVRAHNDTDGRIRNIANHYNRLYKAHCAAEKEGKDKKKIIQNSVGAHELFLTPIYIFGLDKDTFTFGNIIDEHHLKKAMIFRERYNASTRKDYISKTDLSVCAWVKDMQYNLRLNDSGREFAPTLDGMINLRRTQGEDLANSMHVATKIYLANEALGLLDIPHYDWQNIYRDDEGEGKDKKAVYTKNNDDVISADIIKIIRVLAQTEHLRWNASHELLGFTYSNGRKDSDEPNLRYKDEMKMEHGCMLPWEMLSHETQGFDYDVVDVTLGINTIKRRSKQKS